MSVGDVAAVEIGVDHAERHSLRTQRHRSTDHRFSQFGGVDIEWNNGDLSGKTEAYYSAERDVRDQRAFSTEWSWFVSPQWAATYRFDYYDAGADLNLFALAVVPLGHATEHVLGVSFNPNGSVRLRVDLHHLLLPNTDDTIDFVNFSWSISF